MGDAILLGNTKDTMRFCNQCKRSHGPRECKIGKGVEIDSSAIINVSERLVIGHGTKILAHAKIEGRSVIIGRECFFHEYSWIGGGSCFDDHSAFYCGDWFHLGRFAHVNTAASVAIGNQVGIGHMSSVWTHGGYLPVDWHYPHTVDTLNIGNDVWIPHAWVNPGVNIGNSVVVAAMSLINKDLPENCFAAGIPARIRSIQVVKTPFQYIIDYLKNRGIDVNLFDRHHKLIYIADTIFDLGHRTIVGPVTGKTEKTKDLLRRLGIRFPYWPQKDVYEPWGEV